VTTDIHTGTATSDIQVADIIDLHPPRTFESHPGRGRFNAAFFGIMGPYIEWSLRKHKRSVFTYLPNVVVEIGAGTGANLRWIRPGETVIAIEPNEYMHPRLRAAAAKNCVTLDLRTTTAEHTGLPDQSVDCVISSLVLCTVTDPAAVLAEVRRILRPGGTFRYVEHVVAPRFTVTRLLQRIVRRPWAWVFEGCSCERDLAKDLRDAGFRRADVDRYRLHSPFVPFNTQISGIATV
jgi:ubiquinone/menaquinone biosynthesis C-methylase UbiE